MDRKYKIFTINPGSTSTKIALFENGKRVYSGNVAPDPEKIKGCKEMKDELPYRMEAILRELAVNGISLAKTDAFVGRCGGTVGIAGGTYTVNDILLEHTLSGRIAKHPAILGGKMALDLANTYGGRAFIVNPPDVDEFHDLARVTGLSDVFRVSGLHALNQKEIAIRYANDVGKRYEDLNLVISHIGGGISVTAHRKGLMIDSNHGINGEGPMAPTRAGAIPAVEMIKLCYSGKYTEKEMYNRITKTGGFLDHLGTAEIPEVLERIEKGDKYAKLILDAMIYQISKYIGAFATVLKGQVDAILLTGGIANNEYVVNGITDMVKYIAPVNVYAGEFEMEALAAGATRVLNGVEEPKIYTGEPVWSGFEK